MLLLSSNFTQTVISKTHCTNNLFCKIISQIETVLNNEMKRYYGKSKEKIQHKRRNTSKLKEI